MNAGFPSASETQPLGSLAEIDSEREVSHCSKRVHPGAGQTLEELLAAG